MKVVLSFETPIFMELYWVGTHQYLHSLYNSWHKLNLDVIVDHLTTKNWRRNWAVHRTWGDHLSELWLGQYREQSVQGTLAAASGILDTAATACFVADELIKRCSASSPTCRELPRRRSCRSALPLCAATSKYDVQLCPMNVIPLSSKPYVNGVYLTG